MFKFKENLIFDCECYKEIYSKENYKTLNKRLIQADGKVKRIINKIKKEYGDTKINRETRVFHILSRYECSEFLKDRGICGKSKKPEQLYLKCGECKYFDKSTFRIAELRTYDRLEISIGKNNYIEIQVSTGIECKDVILWIVVYIEGKEEYKKRFTTIKDLTNQVIRRIYDEKTSSC